MLVKLLPDQISRFWPYIKYALEQSVPLDILNKPGKLNNILENLLFGGMQNWICVDAEELTVLGNLITTIFEDNCSRTKTIRFYSVYGYEDLPLTEWQEGFHTIREFAKGQGCEFIDAFTESTKIISLVKRFGGDARFTYVTLEI